MDQNGMVEVVSVPVDMWERLTRVYTAAGDYLGALSSFEVNGEQVITEEEYNDLLEELVSSVVEVDLLLKEQEISEE